MSKYIIDIPKTVGMLEAVGSVHYTYFDGIQCQTIILKSDEIEELNSDYINEHYSSLQDDAYQRGLDDAWECAKKLFSEMSDTEIEKVFPVEWKSGFSGLMQMKPQYAMAKIKTYEEKQNAKIEVGNEVKWNSDVIVVTRLYKDGEHDWCDGIGKDGRAFHVLKENVTKTGRHFIIGSILKEMNDEP